MPGMFKVKFSLTGGNSAAVDLAEVNAAATASLMWMGFNIFQTSDVGDAAEEIVKLRGITGYSTSGSGGSAVTPKPTVVGGAAAVFTAEHQNTTKATGGTANEVGAWGWNVRAPYVHSFTEQEQIWLPAATRLIFEMSQAADSLTVEGELLFQEL